MDHDPVIEALVEGFIAEARDICQRVTGHLLALETAESLDEDARKTRYEDLARGLHTLKGNSDTFGFPELAELAHKMEDVIAVYRPQLRSIPNATIDLLLRSIDVFVSRLAARGKADLPPLAELLETLDSAAREEPEQAPSTGGGTSPTAPDVTRPMPVVATPATGADEVVELGSGADAALDDWRVGPRHIEALLHEVERLRELRLRLDEQKREIERGQRLLERVRTPETDEARAVLMSLTRGVTTDGDTAADVVEALENELKTIAMLPMRWILDPLHRSVRDLCRALGREAKLSAVGAEVSLDRRVLVALKGPLVHLVRNAVDHGIEAPDRRVAAGKHREGAITIRVERTGNMVFINVEDDGAGIDPEAVRRQGIARGLVTEEEADAMNERELFQLLFRPGFSTRTDITEVSGRGIGLDVVRAAVQAQQGFVELHTALGSGTRFVLSVPATLGSTPILVVRAAEQVFGIPMASVEMIRAIRPHDVSVSRQASRFEHAGTLLPLVDLANTLGLRAPAPIAPGLPVLIMSSRGDRIALIIDALVGDRDLVVRPLPSEIHDLPAYQGAATLARGDLLLVLQPAFLVEERTGTSAPSAEAARRALVVDDSLTARALHRTILESGGYQVHTAGSAKQALDHLRHAHYDVVIVDVMMADIDGVHLTNLLRGRRETRALPIILVSAHDAAPERERGLRAGADAFLSKKDCISGRLLAEVASIIARKERGT